MNEKDVLKWIFENKPEFRIGDRVWFIQDNMPRTDIIIGIKLKPNEAHYSYELLNHDISDISWLFPTEEALREHIDWQFQRVNMMLKD